MENAYGIEAARAKLGEIADHARTTGQITRLTRHGRTVAVIGPAETVTARATITVDLNFPHEDWTVEMHAVPRVDETLEWETDQGDTGQWKVTEVNWTAHPTRPGSVSLALDPANEYTEQIMAKQDAARKARARAAAANHTAEK